MGDIRSIHDHAAEHLGYIRETMERAGSFTAVPGWGAVVMGLAGLAAAVIAPAQETRAAWLATWLVAAVVAFVVGLVAMFLKAREVGAPLSARPARRFALGFSPAIFAGALLTAACWKAGAFELLPGLWLLLYGAAVVAGGTFSIRVVPFTGLLFLFLGAIALFGPPLVADVCLGTGFGGVQIVFGAYIARYHGG